MSAVVRHIAENNFRHWRDGRGTGERNDVTAFDEIRADIFRRCDGGFFSFVIVNALVCRIEPGKAYYDNMDVRFTTRFAFPCKCAMCEMNLQRVAAE